MSEFSRIHVLSPATRSEPVKAAGGDPAAPGLPEVVVLMFVVSGECGRPENHESPFAGIWHSGIISPSREIAGLLSKIHRGKQTISTPHPGRFWSSNPPSLNMC